MLINFPVSINDKPISPIAGHPYGSVMFMVLFSTWFLAQHISSYACQHKLLNHRALSFSYVKRRQSLYLSPKVMRVHRLLKQYQAHSKHISNLEENITSEGLADCSCTWECGWITKQLNCSLKVEMVQVGSRGDSSQLDLPFSAQ